MKTKSLKSQWHKGCKPVYVGVYERAFSEFYAMWTGSHWKIGSPSIREAARMPDISRYQSNERWRGLRTKT